MDRAAPEVADPARSATLITGDRVTVYGEAAAVVQRGPGRDAMAFLTQRLGDDLFVIPQDALALVREGRLDRRLFNVTLLLDSGYHDQRPDLPLIVARDPGAASPVATTTLPGVEVMQELPVVAGQAIQVDKDQVAGWWEQLTASGGVTVWLDGLRQPMLDHSVPQVGAPAAWDLGWDGSGVTVAVLDTGIDATHPDLADQVVGQANFTEGFEDDRDLVGHGTHVASIVAGTGAASDGRYRGVAPGAQLLDGKVCVEFGCADSWVLAGMQWAAEQGAAVINMSLGGPEFPDDPLVAAVETLTEQYGVLFVVAAGNDGRDGTINSPASADSALAVGAVDADDELAWFSSRGLRHDGALKPDLTAPGVQVVAANSTDGFLGEPDEAYLALSGTSMSSPHVAGAAAILAQRHPDLAPAQLKAALMASASPHAEMAPHAQGAGRLNLARAVVQDVIADPPSVSFTRQQWPHEDNDPETRTFHLHNGGDEDAVLQLELSTIGPDGQVAPDRFFTLDVDAVAVPADGSAEVSLTADTAVGELDGVYGGYLTASAGGEVVASLPFAVDREVESYDVTVRHFDVDGAPVGAFSSLVQHDEMVFADVSGATGTVRLPAADYTLMSFVFSGSGDDNGQTALLSQPRVVVDRDLEIMVDARLAQPISVTVPTRDASLVSAAVDATLQADWGSASFTILGQNFDTVTAGQVGPDEGLPGFTSAVAATFARLADDGSFIASPYRYDLAWFTIGRMVTGLHRDVKRRDLATVHADHVAHVSGASALKFNIGIVPGVVDGGMGVATPTPLPYARTEYHNTDGGVQWLKFFEELLVRDDDPFGEFLSEAVAGPISYQAGRTYRERWNTGVFGPSAPAPSYLRDLPAVGRSGDTLVVAPVLHADSEGRQVFSQVNGSTRVFRDGELIAEHSGLFAHVEVPAEPGEFRVEASATRDARFPLSTDVQVAWQFRSGQAEGEELVPQPVSVIRFTPRLDDRNTAAPARTAPVPVRVQRQPGSPAGRAVSLTVQVSYDDGQTWQDVPVVGRPEQGLVLVTHPAEGGYVSLRAASTDVHGNTVEQTIIRAYQVRPR